MTNVTIYLSDLNCYPANIDPMISNNIITDFKSLIISSSNLEGNFKKAFETSKFNTTILAIILEVYSRLIFIKEATKEDLYSLMKSILTNIVIDPETSEIVGFSMPLQNDCELSFIQELSRAYWMFRALGKLQPTVKDKIS